MRIGHAILVAATIAIPAAAHGQDSGAFAGIDVLGGTAFGTSHTTNGGATWAIVGNVYGVEFGPAAGIKANLGYKFDGPLSVYLSYAHTAGDVAWDADFPIIAASTHIEGTASSDMLLANFAYDLPVSDTTSVVTSAGLGLSVNSLSDIIEIAPSTGGFFANVEGGTNVSPVVELGASLQHQVTDSALLSVGASVSYVGGFKTGSSRWNSITSEPINPYSLDNVWRTNLQASLRFQF